MAAAAGIAGVILAGGRSRRMGGGDKCLQQIGGEPIIAHVIRRLKPQVEALALNANGDPSRFASYALPIVPDSTPDFPGPLAGILAGMQWARVQRSRQVVTAAVDTPFLPRDLVARLADAAGMDQIAVARSRDRLHPTFALWPAVLQEALERFLASGRKARVMDFIQTNPWTAVDFQMEPLPAMYLDPFFNINTPDDRSEAERIADLLS